MINAGGSFIIYGGSSENMPPTVRELCHSDGSQLFTWGPLRATQSRNLFFYLKSYSSYDDKIFWNAAFTGPAFDQDQVAFGIILHNVILILLIGKSLKDTS